MSTPNNLMKLNIGDWSKDGHEKLVSRVYLVNKTIEQVQEAYKKSCELTGASFDDSDPILRDMFVNYEEDSLTQDHIDLLSKFDGLFEHIEQCRDEYYISSNFGDFWWWFVKLSDPEIDYELVEIPNINGFWDKNLNRTFGYGMF